MFESPLLDTNQAFIIRWVPDLYIEIWLQPTPNGSNVPVRDARLSPLIGENRHGERGLLQYGDVEAGLFGFVLDVYLSCPLMIEQDLPQY